MHLTYLDKLTVAHCLAVSCRIPESKIRISELGPPIQRCADHIAQLHTSVMYALAEMQWFTWPLAVFW